MTLAIDTNVLARAILDDDPVQSPRAKTALAQATDIYVPTVVLCELVWVLTHAGWDRAACGQAVRRIVEAAHVRTEIAHVLAGLAMLETGGDFADGVLRRQAIEAGCDRTLTFDRIFARLGAPDVELVS